MTQTVTVKSAQGLTGFLHSRMDGTFYFRVYTGNEETPFTDYDIHHCDLRVTINDEDAFLYERDGGRNSIDYSPDTLGQK